MDCTTLGVLNYGHCSLLVRLLWPLRQSSCLPSAGPWHADEQRHWTSDVFISGIFVNTLQCTAFLNFTKLPLKNIPFIGYCILFLCLSLFVAKFAYVYSRTFAPGLCSLVCDHAMCAFC